MSLQTIIMKIIPKWAELWREVNPFPNDKEGFKQDMIDQTNFMKALAELEMSPEVRHFMYLNLRARRVSRDIAHKTH